MNTNAAELVALDGAGMAMDEVVLKHLAVLFTRIAVPSLRVILDPAVDASEFAKARAELIDANILFEPVVSPFGKDTVELLMQDSDELLKPTTGLNTQEVIEARKDEKKSAEIRNKTNEELFKDADPQKVMNASKRISTNLTRLVTTQLRQAENLDACAVVSAGFNSLDEDDDAGHDVMKIGLTSLPAPSDDVSWKQILEYRSDPESFNRFRDLKDWMTDTARGKLTPGEVREKLESLLDQYRKHFQTHQMNTVNATLAAFIVSSADALRNLTTVRWGKAESMFTLERRKLALLQEESTSEGSLVALVVKSEMFNW